MAWTVGYRTKGSEESFRYTMFYETEGEADGVKLDWEAQEANAGLEFSVIEVPGQAPEPEALEPAEPVTEG